MTAKCKTKGVSDTIGTMMKVAGLMIAAMGGTIFSALWIIK